MRKLYTHSYNERTLLRTCCGGRIIATIHTKQHERITRIFTVGSEAKLQLLSIWGYSEPERIHWAESYKQNVYKVMSDEYFDWQVWWFWGFLLQIYASSNAQCLWADFDSNLLYAMGWTHLGANFQCGEASGPEPMPGYVPAAKQLRFNFKTTIRISFEQLC